MLEEAVATVHHRLWQAWTAYDSSEAETQIFKFVGALFLLFSVVFFVDRCQCSASSSRVARQVLLPVAR